MFYENSVLNFKTYLLSDGKLFTNINAKKHLKRHTAVRLFNLFLLIVLIIIKFPCKLIFVILQFIIFFYFRNIFAFILLFLLFVLIQILKC